MGILKTDQRAGVHSFGKGGLRLPTSERLKTSEPTSRGETLLKEVLDFIFQDEHYRDNYRPGWLSGLELDRCYPRLKIAFEYQGFQHSYFVPHYHETIEDYKNQRGRDKEKQQLCRKQKVILIHIYYWQLSIGQVCQQATRTLRKRKKWQQADEIRKIVRARFPKAVGGKNRKAINRRCADYKKLVKANYDSKKWVKHHQAYAKRHYPKGRRPGRNKKHKRPAQRRDWSREIAQAERELRAAREETQYWP